MKRRAMKKWIPKGSYCYYSGTNKFFTCKWRKYIGIMKRDRSNCKFANECNEKCWTKPNNSCRDTVFRCEYLNFTDWNEESLLWDSCKECVVKE